MREPLALDDRRGAPWTGAHGLGLQVWNSDGARSFGHGGSMPGFLAIMRMDPESGDGAVVMANATSGLRPMICEELTRILAEHEPLAGRGLDPGAGAGWHARRARPLVLGHLRLHAASDRIR